MSDDFTCDECDRSFDSERGLHIHHGRVHKDEPAEDAGEAADAGPADGGEEDAIVAREEDGTITLSLPVFHALGVVFVLGVVFGGFIMGAAATVTPQTGMNQAQVQSLAQALQDGSAPSGSDTGTQPTGSDGGTGDSGPPTVNISKMTFEHDPMLGDKDAPVTIVEFTDHQCPFCTLYDNRTFPKIRENFIETGKVRYIVKDFPIPQLGHRQAPQMARAGYCALQQDKYWEFKEKVMSEQMAMAPRGTAHFDDAQLREWIRQTSIDMQAYTQCMNNTDNSEWRQDKQQGNSFSVTVSGSPFISGTPSFVIYRTGSDTGTPLVGAQPYSAFRSEINALLEG